MKEDQKLARKWLTSPVYVCDTDMIHLVTLMAMSTTHRKGTALICQTLRLALQYRLSLRRRSFRWR